MIIGLSNEPPSNAEFLEYIAEDINGVFEKIKSRFEKMKAEVVYLQIKDLTVDYDKKHFQFILTGKAWTYYETSN